MRQLVDKVVLRIIASAQGLLSLVSLVMTPVLFNYGGAAANPTAFQLLILFWLWGAVSAICLFSVRLWARLLVLVWNVVLLSYVVVAFLRAGHRANAERALLAVSTLVTAYLLISAGSPLANAYRQSPHRRTVRRWMLFVTTVIALALIGARLAYSASHTQRALAAKLDSPTQDTRCSAAQQLALRGRAAAATLPKLTAILGTTSCIQWGSDQLPEYIEAIGDIDPFLELMKNGNGRAVEKAAMQLMYRPRHYATRRTSDLVSAFADGLHNSDLLVRRTSAAALGTFGMSAAQAAPDLIRSLNDPDGEVRTLAANSLGRMHSVDGLKAALANADSAVRHVAIYWSATP
ncbi:MAG TPA: HEAT repeat domain-containing protein [Gemmatimonadaceae bacterium]|nr:HEAT repeat domain-containing protein [Gemmatimonadaceae bacterium]